MTFVEISDIVFEARGISKSFPGVKALEGVDLTLRSGRLTALLGENGAGKSTLMNVMAGVLAPDQGELLIHGNPVRLTTPRDARDHGIAMIFQELSLVPDLTVAENIFLGREPLARTGMIDYRVMNRNAAEWLQRLDLDVSPTTPVGRLRVGQQQLVEIARALAGDVRILIMDEPTSAITEHETEVLYQRIADLKKQGVAIVYITHRLEELNHIADEVTVMRDGHTIGTAAIGDISRDEIVRMMAGRDVKTSIQTSSATDQEVLRVENMMLKHPTRPGDFLVNRVCLNVKQGEVLGIFGLMGAGRTELLECLFGLHHRSCSGDILIGGHPVSIRSPGDAIAHGLALVPEDRKRDGLVLPMTVAENANLASLDGAQRFGFLNRRKELRQVEKSLQRFRVKTPSLHQKIRNLSGGNQQKVILGKWLATEPKVLMLDEPTRGIDIQAKNEIYSLINELTGEGLTVLAVSSELPEVMAISDRILVLCEGRVSGEFSRQDATEEKIMRAALPGSHRSSPPPSVACSSATIP
ncbi:Ribose import ATP-binding protein RbsA [Rubripirellula lacrimiformis]|uniref:Ribose import ATP-binding protein RbsA n=1 Tax=Rubripirellula lacrimiformis TaxID=1930273 RepID=A0A517N978_9BACT|nr:sugar ABC transporter ATP-binding protein [Rubripirellula lacrimiformis]QDT03689.1 Ribose import ATP-binding protein RbsA [Rubripirellula lacrimiformis]